MRKLCFIVNVDWFFCSHRLPLARRLSSQFETSVIAGNSGFETSHPMERFQVKARIPTIKGVREILRLTQAQAPSTSFIVVSPVMIFICHFALARRSLVYYNFSGLGFLRKIGQIPRNAIFLLMKLTPIRGRRILVVQNSDDLRFLSQVFSGRRNFQVELIPGSGFEGQQFQPKPESNQYTIGFVGRIRKDKGVLTLIEAVNILRSRNQPIDLAIWGQIDKPERHGFSNEELLYLEQNQSFLRGYSDDKEAIFQSFDWFCLPSNGEGLSKAAIEATSFRCPLILSDVEGNRDMIDGNGFLFPYADISALISVIDHVISTPTEDFKAMSEKSFELFQSNWTIESIANQWTNLLIKHDPTCTERAEP